MTGRSRLALVATLLAARLAVAAPPDGTTSVPGEIVLMEGPGRHLAFIAEKSTQQFHVYEWKNDRARLIETLPCTTGKVSGDKRIEGDLKTPEGIYRFVRSIDGRQLPPLYGAGALVMDYPNPMDRLAGKTGGGIWMHGVETEERVHVARDTRGCVALGNATFDRIAPLAQLHETPIIVVEKLEGVSPQSVSADARAMLAFVEAWRSAWENRDFGAYMRHYSARFSGNGRDLRSWERHKREVAAREGPRRIGLADFAILREKTSWHVTFRQEYLTAEIRDVGRKTLFIHGAGPEDWRIVSETWRALDSGFRLVDPTEIQPVLSPDLIAAMAPDAAPPATSRRPRPAKAEPRTPAAAEPAAAAPTELPPAAEETADEPAPAVETAATLAEPVAEAVTPVEALEPAAPEAAPVATRLEARLPPATTTRGTFALIGPHVQRRGESLFLQVQLLNLRATSVRSGALVLRLPWASDASPEPFTLKQGRLIALELPDGELPMSVGVTVLDSSGSVAHEQAIVIEAADP